MRQQRIIDIAKLKVESKWTEQTKECHKRNYTVGEERKSCWIIWDKKIYERIWILCDQITILKPWLWQEFLLKAEAA